MTASAEPTAADETILKTTIADEIDVDLSALKNFQITVSEVTSATRNNQREQQRRRLASYIWDVTFDVEVSLSELDDDSVGSSSQFEKMVEETLSDELLAELEDEGLPVTGLSVETTAVSGDDDGDDSARGDDGLSAASLGAAIGVPVAFSLLLCIGLLYLRYTWKQRGKERDEQHKKSMPVTVGESFGSTEESGQEASGGINLNPLQSNTVVVEVTDDDDLEVATNPSQAGQASSEDQPSAS